MMQFRYSPSKWVPFRDAKVLERVAIYGVRKLINTRILSLILRWYRTELHYAFIKEGK